jgi:quercetin dioxygenase-like cupin family protein
MTAPPVLLTAATDLASGGTAQLFRGSEFGVDVSFFLNHVRPGSGAEQHRHPYGEVFVVLDGEAEFTVGETAITARGGRVVVVPAGAAHSFHNPRPATLEMVSIHPVAEMQTEWIERS